QALQMRRMLVPVLLALEVLGDIQEVDAAHGRAPGVVRDNTCCNVAVIYGHRQAVCGQHPGVLYRDNTRHAKMTLPRGDRNIGPSLTIPDAAHQTFTDTEPGREFCIGRASATVPPGQR